MSNAVEGYKQKPTWINVLASLYFIQPIANTFFLVVKNDTGFSDFMTLVPWYYHLFILLSLVVGVGLIKVRIWGWYLLIFHAIFAIVGTLLNKPVDTWATQPMVWFNLIYVFPVAYFLQKEIRAPYFNPRLRWWEQHKRLKEELNVEVLRENNEKLTTSTFDISEGGCFLQVDGIQDFVPGALLKLNISIDNLEYVKTEGEVVWVSPGEGQYPQGLGIKFINLAKEGRWTLEKYIKKAVGDASMSRS